MTPKQRRLERMRAIEREWRVASIAAENLGEYLRANPSALAERELRITDYRNFRDNLESTYLIRVFAEFEAGLREAWALAFRQTTSPRMRDLIDSFSARCIISQEWCDCAHEVRAYRNALIHEGDGEVQPIGIREACGWLCRFFSRVPHDW
jgi:hypothetical protein